MWPFTQKKSLEKSGLMQGFTDHHSHVLPGVDDGIQTEEESLKVLKAYEALGVDTLWLTPHIMEDVPNRPDDLRRRYDALCELYHGPVRLKLAAENMLDNLFDQRLAARDVLPIGESKTHLLVETSYFTPPSDFDAKIQNVFSAGFFPLLAHPERYVYMDLKDYRRLHEQGVKMQLNLSSLMGFYGQEIQKKAEHILRQGYYNAVGSDTHRYSQVEMSIARGALKKSALNMLRLVPGID